MFYNHKKKKMYEEEELLPLTSGVQCAIYSM